MITLSVKFYRGIAQIFHLEMAITDRSTFLVINKEATTKRLKRRKTSLKEGLKFRDANSAWKMPGAEHAPFNYIKKDYTTHLTLS